MWNRQNNTPSKISVNFSFEHEIDYAKRLELSSGCVEIIETFSGLIEDICMSWYQAELDTEQVEVLFNYIWTILWVKSLDVSCSRSTMWYNELSFLKDTFEEMKENLDTKIKEEHTRLH